MFLRMGLVSIMIRFFFLFGVSALSFSGGANADGYYHRHEVLVRSLMKDFGQFGGGVFDSINNSVFRHGQDVMAYHIAENIADSLLEKHAAYSRSPHVRRKLLLDPGQIAQGDTIGEPIPEPTPTCRRFLNTWFRKCAFGYEE